MLTHNGHLFRNLFVAISIVLLNCTPHELIKSNSVHEVKHDIASSSDTATETNTTDHYISDTSRENSEIDFADAFDTTKPLPEVHDSLPSTIHQDIPEVPVSAMQFAPYQVPTKMVRVAIATNCRRTVIYSVGNAILIGKKQKKPFTVQGRILFEIADGGKTVQIDSRMLKTNVTLPCTLQSENEYNFLDIGDATYRGSIVLVPAGTTGYFLVNVLDMEEYLRGVVPLELGKRTSNEIEALKAQAVAARTYAYNKILERTAHPYDMVHTIADQVYGGASVEYRESDIAVRATRDLLLTYNGRIIYAYYHSTCGGTTAAISEVWNQPSQSYLCAVDDKDSTGKAYCSLSTYYSWDESWNLKQFSMIIRDNIKKILPQKLYSVPVTDFIIDDRFSCGRIKKARIIGKGWEQSTGGDQVRYIIRRGVTGYPILRSANITRVTIDRSRVRFSGKGYGHGIGMCQMGAIGRARVGQNFVNILNAYYTGVTIVAARTAMEKK